MMMLTLLQILLLVFLVMLALPVLYLLLLTAAAWRARQKSAQPASQPAAKFAFLIPAHNEEKLLAECLENLRRLDYPAAQYSVWVIADNCSDRTAEIARAMGVQVTERYNPDLRGKGYALQWGLRALLESSQPRPDAVVILDADSSVTPNFLRVMAGHLAAGEQAIQSYYSVRNAERSWSENLRYVALTVLHYLRPQGRMVLGGSAGLKGNGMVFVTELLERHPWTASITEDIEFHMALLFDGQRVTFAGDAEVRGEMPNSLAGAQTQVDRWERGRLEMARRYVPALLLEAWRALRQGRARWSFVLFDAACEHLIPPFSILVGLTALGLLAGLVLVGITQVVPVGAVWISAAWLSLALAAGLVAGQIIYILSGLKMAQAPKSAYRTLLYTPVFIVWKFWHSLRIVRTRAAQGWVRTARNGGS